MFKFSFFILFYSISAFALQGRLELPGKEEISVGDVFDAELLIFKYEGSDAVDFSILEGQIIADSFYIVEANSIKKLRDETEDLKIELTLILKKMFTGESDSFLLLGDFNIPVALPQIKISDQKLKIQDFIVWKQKELAGYSYKWWSFVLLVFFIGFFAVWITRKKKRNELEAARPKQIQLVKDMVNKAKSRPSVEKIYQHRSLLRKIYGEKNANDFLNALNQCQYRPDWTKEDQANIEEKLHKLRIAS